MAGYASPSNRLVALIESFAWRGDADPQPSFSGEESEAKKIVASIRSQPLPEAEHSDEGEKDDQDTKNHDIDGPDAPTSQEDDHETDSSQYSSESSDLAHCTEAKATNFVEPEKPRRPSTRSQGGKKTG